MVGLVQYYTLQGSYFMNQYLRKLTKYEYRNDYLEDNIEKMWRLVLDAPAFDLDYILYRFVSTDDYLKHLGIGDIYQDQGFTSTTRDPFYRNDLYKFGFILIKIKIPKKIKGVGLCLETLSHFPAEEEIILPPMTKLKLIAKDYDIDYYHPDESFVSDIKTRYEFEWVGNIDIVFPSRPTLLESNPHHTKLINFLNIKTIKSMSIREKIDFIMKTYFDPMNRIKCQIGDNIFYVVGEWYDSTGAYFDMYSIKTSEGFSLYSIYDGYILFMIEIDDTDGVSQIRVNYYTKYSRLNRQKIMGDDNFIKFISSVAHYFDVADVVIYADYMSCDKIRDIKIGGAPKKQRTYMSTPTSTPNQFRNKFKNTETDDLTNDNDDTEKLDTFTGGSYCLDFYQYIKYGQKRYVQNESIVELQPIFSYYDLDTLRSTKPTTILKKGDRDELFQIYLKNYLIETKPDQDNLADFYVWMIENKCYLMDIFVHKMDRLYKGKNNPFKHDMYVLDAMANLYNRNYVQTYNRFIKLNINSDEHQLLDIPKNEYRIRR